MRINEPKYRISLPLNKGVVAQNLTMLRMFYFFESDCYCEYQTCNNVMTYLKIMNLLNT